MIKKVGRPTKITAEVRKRIEEGIIMALINLKEMPKRLVIIPLVFSLLSLSALSVSASTDVDPGIGPDSVLYIFDTAFEKLGLFFAFDYGKKARKALGYANEKLAEAKIAAEKNDLGSLQKAIANYERNINLAVDAAKKIENKEQAEDLFVALAGDTASHEKNMLDQLDSIPAEAKATLSRAVEISRGKHGDIVEQIARLRGEGEQLQKEIAELSQKRGNNEATGIEESNKELNKLFQQRPSPQKPSPAAPVPDQNQSVSPTPAGALVKTDYSGQFDEAMAPVFAQIQRDTGVYNDTIRETTSFISHIRAEMGKADFAGEPLVQQSGQELINEANNIISISRKLIDILTERKSVLSSYLGRDIVPPASVFDSNIASYNNYYAQWQATNSRVESMIKTFVLSQKSILDKLLIQERGY